MNGKWSTYPRTSLRCFGGFTLIELLVVMTILALLLTIAAPRYMGSVDKAKEAVLRENISIIRDTLDKFYNDNGRYPVNLEELVSARYFRKVPIDPVTDSATTWILELTESGQVSGVRDIHSGAPGQARDGTLYREW